MFIIQSEGELIMEIHLFSPSTCLTRKLVLFDQRQFNIPLPSIFHPIWQIFSQFSLSIDWEFIVQVFNNTLLLGKNCYGCKMWLFSMVSRIVLRRKDISLVGRHGFPDALILNVLTKIGIICLFYFVLLFSNLFDLFFSCRRNSLSKYNSGLFINWVSLLCNNLCCTI